VHRADLPIDCLAMRLAVIEGEIKGKIEGEIKLIRILQQLLGGPVAEEQELRTMNFEQLEAMTSGLQVKLRSR